MTKSTFLDNWQEKNNKKFAEKKNEKIKPHSFEVAKKHIETFSNSITTMSDFERVSTDAFDCIPFIDHRVTGEEFNNLIGQIQEVFIETNKILKSSVSEFGQVYNALESLDGEYIPAILSAVKGAEESSNQAKKAQADITNTIERLKKVIDILSDHKKELDKLKHLKNIDDIWKNYETIQDTLSEHEKKFAALKSIENIGDIESIQSDINDAREGIDFLKKQIEGSKTEIKSLSEEQLKSKIKKAYYIAGIAIVMVIANIILNIKGYI